MFFKGFKLSINPHISHAEYHQESSDRATCWKISPHLKPVNSPVLNPTTANFAINIQVESIRSAETRLCLSHACSAAIAKHNGDNRNNGLRQLCLLPQKRCLPHSSKDSAKTNHSIP